MLNRVVISYMATLLSENTLLGIDIDTAFIGTLIALAVSLVIIVLWAVVLNKKK